MRPWISLVTVGVVLAGAIPAESQETKPAAPLENPFLLGRVLDADANHDGKIDPQEFDGVGGSALWAALDSNKDRVVTPDEVRANLHIFLERLAAWNMSPRSSTGLVPLTDLKTGTYKGKEGGLYPGGRNERPAAHEEAGLRLARAIRPLDAQGKPSDSGKIVLLSIGMSNTTQEFSTFKPMADADPARNANLVIVDGAQGAMTARVISRPDEAQGKRFWQTIDDRLQKAGVSCGQVQVVWLKEADAGPKGTDLEHAVALEDELAEIARILKQRFPNLTLCYLSSRIYGGYALGPLNPEPYAYEEGFSVKWLIEKQLAGDAELNYDAGRGAVKAPWLAWGPYLWADGQHARSDGLTYDPTDLRPDDGTHPGLPGRKKVARMLLDFFKTDPTARIWFLGENR
jgi:hypothetical protein